MHFFSKKYTLLLVSILTWNSAVAHVENISRREVTPAKLFTHYSKVPWMNLNSSWEDQVTSLCRDDIVTLFQSADAGEIWALRMLDASSKFPAGLLTGNIHDLGIYSECIGVRGDHNPANIEGRHCMVSMSMPPQVVGDASAALYIQKLSAYNPTGNVALNFMASVCLPSTCGVEDVVGFTNASILDTPELAELGIEVAQVICSSVRGESDDVTLGTILVIFLFAAIATFLIFCTACEFVVRVKSDSVPPLLQTLAKFSLCTNAMKLMSTKIAPGTMPEINGIKCLCLIMLLIAHKYVSILCMPVVNPSDILELKNLWLLMFSTFAPLVIDTFLLISGFFMAYAFMSFLRSGAKMNIPALYFHRYIRLTPSIAAMILSVIFIVPHFGIGPFWETIFGLSGEYCRKNWWLDLLYIQNLVDTRQLCLPHTWYLAVDMQLFWLCPILLYPLVYRPKLGLVLTILVLMASTIISVIQLLANQYAFFWNSTKSFQLIYEETMDFYVVTYNRVLPYTVGILLGYYVVNNKKRLTKAQVAFNWTLTVIFLLICLWNGKFIQPFATVYDGNREAIHISVVRLGWSVANAWIIYACTHGHGGLIGRFFALPIFVPLSRMSYGIYLIGPVIQLALNARLQTVQFFSNMTTAHACVSDVIIATALAFVMNLCFESPVIVLEKMLNAKRPSRIINDPETEWKEKLSTKIKQYPAASNVQIGSDTPIETRMLQPDFWETVSNVLRTSGKRPTKTPTEWVKAWQDWKSHVSVDDRQSKTSDNDIQNDSEQLEAGINTLEKEFLIFLATVSCSLDDVSSVDESEIGNPSATQSDSCVKKRRNIAKQR